MQNFYLIDFVFIACYNILLILTFFVMSVIFFITLYTAFQIIIIKCNNNIIETFCKTLTFFKLPVLIYFSEIYYKKPNTLKHIFCNYIKNNRKYAEEYEYNLNFLCKRHNIEIYKRHNNEICKLIVNKFSTKLNINNEILNIICKNNQLSLFKLLINYGMLKMLTSNQILRCFEIVCSCGHVDFLQFLITTYPNLNIRPKNCGILRLACQNNHIDVVLLILNNYRDINIHVSDEVFFRIACTRGYFDLAKILILKYPDIDCNINDNYCHRKTRINFPHMFKWLEKGCPIKHTLRKNSRKI